jgi:hypothetical protein
VRELEQSWETARSITVGRRTTLDLRALESTDTEGQALLDRMFSVGVVTAKPVVRRRDCRLRFVAAALVPVLFLLCPAPVNGAEPEDARFALDRYLSAAGRGPNAETTVRIEIHARLKKYGRTAVLRAVETIPATGRAAFRLISFEGDDMVKKQVITRYLTAEAEAHERHDESIAVTANNYRFRFLRSEMYEGGEAWVWRVEPKKKRTGLFKGEVWIAADSARVVRQTGKMVKSPSLFVKGIVFTRDFDTEGSPRSLDLHLDTRIAGAAELNVRYETVGL